MGCELKGKALKDRAKELDIAGRGRMSADQLREAIDQEEATLKAAEVEEILEEDAGIAALAAKAFAPPKISTVGQAKKNKKNRRRKANKQARKARRANRR